MESIRKFRVYILIFLSLFIFSCGKKTQVKILPAPVDQAMVMFKEADKSFGVKDFEKALTLYDTFIKKFPENAKTPIALYNSGFIYFLKKDYPKSREYFNQIVSKYEGSSLVIESMIRILNSFYLEGNYREVISYSGDIPDNLEPQSYIIRKYSITGDAYIAEKRYKEAFEAYSKIFDKSEGQEKEIFLRVMAEITESLSSQEIAELKDKSEESSVKILLYYNYALKTQSSDVKDEDIVEILNLIKNNPKHPLTQGLSDLLDRIETDQDCLRALAEKPKTEIKEEKIIYNPNAIGCLLPKGKFEKVGTRIEWGVQYALTKAKGEPVDISFKYISEDPEDAKKAVRELIKEGVSSIIGPFFSPKAAVMEAQKYGVPIITLNWTPDIVDTGEYVFRNSLTNEMQVKTIVRHAIRKLGIRKFAVLYPDNAYGKSFSSLFWREVKRMGGEIRGFEGYEPGVTDFEMPIKKIVGMDRKIPEDLIDWKKKQIEIENKELSDSELKKEAEKKIEEDTLDDDFGEEKKEEKKKEIEQKAVVDFEAIYIPDNAKTVGLILPQLNFHDVFNIQLLGNNIWHSARLIKLARKETQNAVFTEGFYVKSDRPEVKSFVKGFSDIFGTKPSFIEALAFDTAMILLSKIKDPGIKSHYDLKNALLTVKNYNGITGITNFDLFGEAQKDVIMLKIRGRKFVEVKN